MIAIIAVGQTCGSAQNMGQMRYARLSGGVACSPSFVVRFIARHNLDSERLNNECMLKEKSVNALPMKGEPQRSDVGPSAIRRQDEDSCCPFYVFLGYIES